MISHQWYKLSLQYFLFQAFYTIQVNSEPVFEHAIYNSDSGKYI